MPDEQQNNEVSYDPVNNEDFQSQEVNADAEDKHPDQDRTVKWTASEFVAKHKSSSWYGAFFAGLIVVCVVIYFLTKDYFSSIAIAIAGFVFAYLANHKPRQLAYQIDNSGVNIGSKFYPFEQFKSFGLAQDGAIGYINLLPLKRFMPEVSIYFPPEQGDNIIEILTDHLPHDQQDERPVDRLAKKLHF